MLPVVVVVLLAVNAAVVLVMATLASMGRASKACTQSSDFPELAGLCFDRQAICAKHVGHTVRFWHENAHSSCRSATCKAGKASSKLVRGTVLSRTAK